MALWLRPHPPRPIGPLWRRFANASARFAPRRCITWLRMSVRSVAASISSPENGTYRNFQGLFLFLAIIRELESCLHNTLEKVSAFITREGPGGRELLVFAHQNPLAGIVEPSEALDRAVLRETCEESGLSAVRIVRSFPPFITDLPDGYYALIQPTTFRQEPDDHAPAQDIGLGRGTVFSSGSYLLLR